MEIQEYKTIVKKTAIYPNEVNNFGLAYCWLGLIGETEEVKGLRIYNDNGVQINQKGDKNFNYNLFKELGDVIWYSTAIANILHLDLDKILDLNRNVVGAKCPLVLTENIKKYYRDNAILDKYEIEDSLTNNLKFCFNMYAGWFENNIYNYLPEIMQMNYDKLMKRRETNTLSGDGSNREEENYPQKYIIESGEFIIDSKFYSTEEMMKKAEIDMKKGNIVKLVENPLYKKTT